MDYKTITTVLTDKTICDASFKAAQTLARTNEAHLNTLCLGVDHSQQGFYYAGASAMMIQDNLTMARDAASEMEEHARKALSGATFGWSATCLSSQMVALSGMIAHHTRFADLVVLPRPYGEGRGHDAEATVEASLFNGSAPVIIMPDGSDLPETIENVVVAWNESAEALRAIRLAMPFLQKARNVYIAIIDPPTHGPERSDPGGALSQMLSRHGVRAEVTVMARTLPRVSDILNRHARDKDADLIVMGAYGHSRFRESIMGGATRHMLEVAERPVFLAH